MSSSESSRRAQVDSRNEIIVNWNSTLLLKVHVFNNRVDKFIIFHFYMGLFAFPVENNLSEINKLNSVQKFPFQSACFEKYI